MSSLEDVLNIDCTHEIAQHIASMTSFSEQKLYLIELLDSKNSFHMKFLEDFKQKFAYQAAIEASGAKVYKKSFLKDYFSGSSKVKDQSKNIPKRTQEFPKPNQASKQEDRNDSIQESFSNSVHKEPIVNKKTKFVNIYSEEAEHKNEVILKGRHLCQCQATKHKLINNCLNCGKVVCSQEGSGPCLFCDTFVCTLKEQEVINRSSSKSDELMKRIMRSNDGIDISASMQKSDVVRKAEAQKNKLLEFDRNSERRTRVIDDESDYFSVDAMKWMTNEQKQELTQREEEIRKIRHGSKLDLKIDFDFAGRRIMETTTDHLPPKICEDLMIGVNSESCSTEFDKLEIKASFDGDIPIHPFTVFKPQLHDFVPTFTFEKFAKQANIISCQTPNVNKKIGNARLQDAELQEMSDQGLCLSIHQPYASFLVAGIKKHEGRNWYSSHRGRLWIHATSTSPTDAEIKHLKDFYQGLYENKFDFPTNLPTGCLVGYVDLKNVLPQEEYASIYQPCESPSPFVFICENHQELQLKFPMPGKPNIFKLDTSIHRAAKNAPKKLSNSTTIC